MSSQFECKYCGVLTKECEKICDIPSSVAPPTFLLENLFSINGSSLRPDDKVCLEHKGSFRIKHLSFSRGHPFTKSFNFKFTYDDKDNPQKCSKCGITSSARFTSIANREDSFKEFLIEVVKLNFIFNI